MYVPRGKSLNYEKKFTYLENITASSSQIFILSYYFPKVFIKKTLGINNITCVNSNFTKYLNQRNEFELFKAVSLFPLKKSIFSKEIEQVVSLADPKTCAGCEGGDGECDASGNYCGEDPICESKKIKSEVVTLGLISKVTSETLFNESLYYNLRDKLMAKHNKGKKYIKYYYAISRFNNVSDYKLNTLYKMITTLPDFNSSIERLVNKTNNDDVIIIDTQLKNNLLSIIADLKLHSSNENYQNIMRDLENDIVFISNKSKATVLNELQ